ncbi:MAG: histidinol-phosphate transaminase [Isosphaeraceae bacterium]
MSVEFQAHVARMSGYAPGEQPRDGGFIKLNTNENPYSPSTKVAEAIARGLDGRLRLYPDPVGTAFRRSASRLHDVDPESILCGNGSDDLLTIVARAFLGPGEIAVAPSPSYILYQTLTDLQNARLVEVPFEDDWSLDPQRFAVPGAKLAFLANPNSPSGTALSPVEVAKLAEALPCPIVVDEAYVDFAESHCVDLVRTHENVIVLRTLSKGYGLAGLRFGYAIARPEVVEGLIKVKDSYNCDSLSLLGAEAAIEDQDHRNLTRAKVVATRKRLAEALRGFGYRLPESQANFVWCEGGLPASSVYEALKERKILVRLMRYSGREPALRITVGTDDEIDRLLAALKEILR